MSDSNEGPFKRLSMPWFPFSVPATILAALALVILEGVFALVALMTDHLDGAADARRLFFYQLSLLVQSLRIEPDLPGGRLLFVTGALSCIVIWAYFGVAICRCLALRLSRDEYLGVRDALAFARSKFLAAVLFPVIVVGCLVLLGLVNAVIGLLMQIPYLGLFFYLFLPVAYLMTALMIIIFFTAIFGAGMVSGALAIECRGTLDAWGKALNYTFARPLHVIVYIVLLKVFLVDCLLGFGLGRGLLGGWTQSSLSPLWENASLERIFHDQADGGFESAAAWLWRFFSGLASLGLSAVVLGFAFAGFTAMFLILRRDVDGIDVTEIELDGPSADPTPRPVPPAASESAQG